MPKITFIGAGSMVFTRNLVRDVMSFVALEGSEVCLMDINDERLESVRRLVLRMIDQTHSSVTVTATTSRETALTDADYIVVTIQVGGPDAWDQDIQIPARYGVSQCVGDTLGPGGVFRGLRHLTALEQIVMDMERLCPDALMLQYSNPMAILTGWVSMVSSIQVVGLCHSVQGTARMLADLCEVPYEELFYWAAGINHQAWFLRLEHHKQDLYPRLRSHLANPESLGHEPVRFELLRRFGYFVTESSGHASEYSPYFRKRPDLLDQLVASFTNPDPHSEWFGYGVTGGCPTSSRQRHEAYYASVARQISGAESISMERSDEYGARIINAIETGEVLQINANVKNTHLIKNLPDGCCVEVPCLVNRGGVHPLSIGDLPSQLAALNRSNVAVQELTIQGFIDRNRELVMQALALDPLTSAVLSLQEIWDLGDAMFEANLDFLPEFH